MEQIAILVVDDEKEIADLVEIYLVSDGYKVFKANNAKEGLEILEKEEIHLVLLDIMLPDVDGLTICKRTRELSNVPIMMLSAKDDIETKVVSLDIGANDYLTKPFNSKELFARIRVLLRERHQLADRGNFLQLNDITLFLDRHEVMKGTKKLKLTKKEFELLAYLVRNKNIVLSRSRIVEEVWGYDYIGDTNIVDVYIRYLRSKLGPNGRNYIRTVRGVGYVAED